jgi:ABC-2 type transport system permease protein
MKTFKKLLKVEFKRIFSNSVLLAIFFGAPIIYGVLFGNVYKNAKVIDLPIVIIDEDHSPISSKIIEGFEDNEGLLVSDIRYAPGNIQEEMPTKQYVATITIPAGFEADIFQKRHPEIRVDLNMANLLNANTASKNIQSILMTLNAGIEIEGLKKQGLHQAQAMESYESFKINYNKLYNSTGNYVTFMMPGLLGGIMQQIIFLAMALVFSRDFEDGYFRKLAKINKWSFYHIILKSTPFFIMLPAIWLIVSLFVPYFNMNIDIFNLPMLVLTILLTLSSMSIGMLFSIAIPNQLRATELLMVISTPAFILSGFTWPTLAIPQSISNISQFIPLTQYLSGFRKVAFYSGDMTSIWPEIKILLIITFTAYISLLGILQFKIHRSRKKELAK